MLHILRTLLMTAALLITAAACNLSGESRLPSEPMPESLTPTGSAQPTLPSTLGPSGRATPDLSSRPQVWFGPMPPLLVDEGRPYIGAEDFMDLFSADSPWQTAADQVHVFQLFGEWIGDDPWTVHASDEELQQVIADLNRRGMAIAMEAGPLVATPDCGENIEGFAGGLITIPDDVERIESFGGTLSFLSMDEPYVFASIYDGPNACRWPAEKVAEEVFRFVEGMRRRFPGIVIGDNEPLWAGMDVDDIKRWIDAYYEAAGEHLPYLHLDVDYSRPNWAAQAVELETYTRERGIEFGVIYIGNGNDPNDEAWISQVGERIVDYELEAGGRPDHAVFESWVDKPDRTIPDNDPFTFTGLIVRYFEDKANLGFQREGPGANLALERPVRVSAALPDAPGNYAVDGNSETWWGAGDFPTQWIEIDLGAPSSIAEVRLMIGQSPDGATQHNLYGRAADPDGGFTLLHSFEGETIDLEILSVTAEEPWPGIQVIRVETVESPSWVSWREIEIISAQ